MVVRKILWSSNEVAIFVFHEQSHTPVTKVKEFIHVGEYIYFSHRLLHSIRRYILSNMKHQQKLKGLMLGSSKMHNETLYLHE